MLKQMQFDEASKTWQGMIQGELDAVEAPRVIADLQALLDEQAGNVLLDCKQLEFVDSMGLGALVRLRKITEEKGGGVSLINMKKRIFKLFAITGLEDSFQIEVES